MNTPWSAVWLLVALPLAGFMFQALLGGWLLRQLGTRYGRWVCGAAAVLSVGAAFAVASALTYRLWLQPAASRSVIVTAGDWISLPSLRIPFEALIDPLSMTMALIITGIGALIHLYATGYMSKERDYARFFCYLNLFIAFMLVLVLANNLPLLFIGWEGVGLCSYLLIGYWYKDLDNARAANKAFIVNRIGDYGLTLGLFLIVAVFAANSDKLAGADGRWLSYDVILPNAVAVLAQYPLVSTAIALLLFVGACGKSAQFPLYFWLPDAMAGPTPVSALIHAATMVTAGVFLVNRMHVVFELSTIASAVMAVIGAFTALFAAVVAFGQTDIKKVLAFSTVSQLGFMFVACGAGVYWAGMFHVTTHAFFKALLFLGAGAVIYAMSHEQDMRKYGRLLRYLPITGATMLVAWLAISGVPPFAGFYSKEAIIGGALAGRQAVASGLNLGVAAGWTALGVAALTAMYMTRLTWLTFFGDRERWRDAEPGGDHAEHIDHAHAQAHQATAAHQTQDASGFYLSPEELALRARLEEPEHHEGVAKDHTPREVPVSMWLPLVVLAVLSIAGGLVLERNGFFERWLYPNGSTLLGRPPVEVEGVPLMLLSLLAAGAGIVAGMLVYLRGLPKSEGWDERAWPLWRKMARSQFDYDKAVTATGVKGGNLLGLALWRGMDATIIDGMVNGVGYLARGLGSAFRTVQTGFVRAYALLMLVGGLGFLGYLIYALSRSAEGRL